MIKSQKTKIMMKAILNKEDKRILKIQLTTMAIMVCILSILVLLSGCMSAKRHVEKALKKDPNIILCDTIKTERIIEKEVFKTSGFDSITVDNDKIYIKVSGEGKINLVYELKVQKITTEKIVPIIKPSKTNTQIRQEERTARKEIGAKKAIEKNYNNNQASVAKVKDRQEAKKVKFESKAQWWNQFWIGFVSAIILIVGVKILKNKFYGKALN